MNYPFTQEAEKAIREWGCNCGPSALAFACQISLDKARAAIAGFNEKRYTSPSMMKAALGVLGVPFDSMLCRRKCDPPRCPSPRHTAP